MWGPDPALSRILFDAIVAHSYEAGWEVWVGENEGNVLGVALWVPPGVEYE